MERFRFRMIVLIRFHSRLSKETLMEDSQSGLYITCRVLNPFVVQAGGADDEENALPESSTWALDRTGPQVTFSRASVRGSDPSILTIH